MTIGWLLWHVEWWWTNAVRAVEGEKLAQPGEHRWSGSTAGVLECKNRWDGVLRASDLDRWVTRLMPTPQSLAFVAAWVNFELVKNLSEINQLLVHYGNEHRMFDWQIRRLIASVCSSDLTLGTESDMPTSGDGGSK